MPNALDIGLLGPLRVRDETGNPVHVGGRQLRVLLTLLALDAGRVVPVASLAGQLWPEDLPGNPVNALQTLVSRLRAELRQAGAGDVIESHPAGYRLAVPPGAVDVMAFEELAAQGRRALTDGDAGEAARILRDALLTWRTRIEADLALGEGASLVGELRVLLSADPLAERPAPSSCARCTPPGARPRRSSCTTRAANCSPISSGWIRPPSSSTSTSASCEAQPLAGSRQAP